MSPVWADSAIWWSVYPLGACGAPIRQGDLPGVHHRLLRLEGWLDHLIELGCNGLALGPIWVSSTHGYDVVDHLEIDPRLGDEGDFDRLVASCQARGIRVLLDGVFNHVSAEHGAVRRVRAEGWGSPAARLLRRDDHQPDGLARFEGHAGLVELDHSHEEVADYVVQVMGHWLDRGADGWRLDAAYRVPSGFWAEVLPRVRAGHPQMVTVAEVLHGDYAAIADQAGFDSVTQYELWKAVWSSIKDRNPHELAWTIGRHQGLSGHLLPWLFVGNHDVTRIASQIGPRPARVATGIMMTLAGMPSVYYGDELGFTGWKEERLGGDDAIRPELGDRPGSLSAQATETYRLAQLSIRLRRTHPWLSQASTQVVDCTREHLVWRTQFGPDQWIRAELELVDEPSLRISDPTGELLLLT